jgi:hypothetical protein
MNRVLVTSAAVATCVAVSGVSALAVAPALFETHFANVQGGTPCYARTYDDAHLKAHPKQTVKAVELEMERTNPDGIVNTAQNFELGFGVQVTRSDEWYVGLAICKDSGGAIDCFLEGDGGRFQLAAEKDGALKIATGDYGIVLEGAKDVVELSGTEGDDKVFLVSPSDRSVCDAASASGETAP